MKGFSIAVNDWGVHAILYSGFMEAVSPAWLSQLRDACDLAAKRDRAPGLFLDLRDAAGAVLSPAHLDGLAKHLTRAGLGRSAVLLSDPALAKRLGALLDKAAASGVRILVSDGRDRVLIAAAYGWILNGREPSATRPMQAPSGAVLPFAKPPVLPASALAGPTMRAAS